MTAHAGGRDRRRSTTQPGGAPHGINGRAAAGSLRLPATFGIRGRPHRHLWAIGWCDTVRWLAALEHWSVGVVGRFASGSIRIVRIGGSGIAIAAACYWTGRHTGGLTGFGATIASLAVVAVTLGLVAALCVEYLTRERQSESRVVELPSTVPRHTSSRRGRCGICNQQRVRVGATLLCPNCDQHPT